MLVDCFLWLCNFIFPFCQTFFWNTTIGCEKNSIFSKNLFFIFYRHIFLSKYRKYPRAPEIPYKLNSKYRHQQFLSFILGLFREDRYFNCKNRWWNKDQGLPCSMKEAKFSDWGGGNMVCVDGRKFPFWHCRIWLKALCFRLFFLSLLWNHIE